MNKKPERYQRTLFDRHGPVAAEYLRAAAYGVAVAGLLLSALSTRHGISLFAIGTSVAAGALVGGLGLLMGHVAGSVWHAVAVRGGSVPSEREYSSQHTLIMQGKVEDALFSFEAIWASDPNALRARLIAAEIYARERDNPARAAELLCAAQAASDITPGDDIHIANRLVDLYIGPLNAPGRAFRELRRLIDRYGNTSAGAHTRVALAKLKEQYFLEPS